MLGSVCLNGAAAPVLVWNPLVLVTLATGNRRRPPGFVAAFGTAAALGAVISAGCAARAHDGDDPVWIEPLAAPAVAAQPIVFRWAAVPGADGYRLRVGTRPGAHDLLDVQGISRTTTTHRAGELPALQALYARISARTDGTWRHSEIQFRADRVAAEWIYPAPGSPVVEPGQAFEWTPIPRASAYRVSLGTAPGLADVLDRTVTGSTRLDVAGLPRGRRLVARLSTRVQDRWYSRDSDFAVELGYRAAQPTEPRPAGIADAHRPFEWQPVPLATGYRLRIGPARGSATLFDSGVLGVTRTFVADLPPGRNLFATLTTVYADRTLDHEFEFRAGQGAPDEKQLVEAALAATLDVRAMAGPRGAWPRTPLAEMVVQQRVSGPGCVELALVLLRALEQQRSGLPARLFSTCLLGNLHDCHTLVELYLPHSDRWMLLDPTFAVTARRVGGDWATARDISGAVRREDWTGITFVPLEDASFSRLHAYYIDYPLLFVSPFGQGQPHPDGGPTILRYYEEVPLPVRVKGHYAIRCRSSSEAEIVLDGRPALITCQGPDALSEIRVASSIEESDASRVRVYKPRRFVF